LFENCEGLFSIVFKTFYIFKSLVHSIGDFVFGE